MPAIFAPARFPWRSDAEIFDNKVHIFLQTDNLICNIPWWTFDEGVGENGSR